jgi:hypothetical protein
MEKTCSSETPVDFQLHGVIYQKIDLFITTAVITSYRTTHFSLIHTYYCLIIRYRALQAGERRGNETKVLGRGGFSIAWRVRQ